ncbi:MAG: hypothetical protein QOD74_1364 [Variibacter sp.]|nr:hypothetical protein [Variibacter sp.]
MLTALIMLLSGPVVSSELRFASVTDSRTGLAIYGFDPVEYFAAGRAAPGLPAHEYAGAGSTWRFRNDGNRAAFAASPDVYAPAFGGHDPTAIGSGLARPGNPLIWTIHKGQLFLFESERSRAGFLGDPEMSLNIARARWPAAAKLLDF